MAKQDLHLRSRIVFDVYHKVMDLYNPNVRIKEIYDLIDVDFARTNKRLSLNRYTFDEYIDKYVSQYYDYYFE